ncbi:MAG: dihydrodipicolinate synthase family protein [Bryobacterales bacterium]|nr:dihydrodipicolinate synthase family protein [Bryobacterales bacterium]MDE0626578.1 dihydrodipicolinate synthase family protein [Bryobacterales bacterium]
MTRGELKGIVPVLPTPFGPDDAIDLESLRRVVAFCAEKGLGAACIPAYASEFYKLTMAERHELVETAVRAAGGKVQIIAQANHFSGRLAGEIARRNEALGADIISVAIPRMFDISEADVFRFLESVLESTSLPVLVQDFNPGGPTISAALARRVNEEYPHFRYLKLEQPLMAPRVVEILDETRGAVQVLEGWGGLYLLEGIRAGICGAMPALGVADVLQETFDLASAGAMDAASDRFEPILPYLVFSLQNMELLLRMEKSLLVRRGLLASDRVRDATLTPDPKTAAYAAFLIDRVMRVVDPV